MRGSEGDMARERAYAQSLLSAMESLKDPVSPDIRRSIWERMVLDCEGLLIRLLSGQAREDALYCLMTGKSERRCGQGPAALTVAPAEGQGVRVSLAHLLPIRSDRTPLRTASAQKKLWESLYYRPLAAALKGRDLPGRAVIWYVHVYSPAQPWTSVPDNDRYDTRPFTNILTQCAGMDDNPDRVAMLLSSCRLAEEGEGEHTDILLLPFDPSLRAVQGELARHRPLAFRDMGAGT